MFQEIIEGLKSAFLREIFLSRTDENTAERKRPAFLGLFRKTAVYAKPFEDRHVLHYLACYTHPSRHLITDQNFADGKVTSGGRIMRTKTNNG